MGGLEGFVFICGVEIGGIMLDFYMAFVFSLCFGSVYVD
jgi:hypothetical protein